MKPVFERFMGSIEVTKNLPAYTWLADYPLYHTVKATSGCRAFLLSKLGDPAAFVRVTPDCCKNGEMQSAVSLDFVWGDRHMSASQAQCIAPADIHYQFEERKGMSIP